MSDTPSRLNLIQRAMQTKTSPKDSPSPLEPVSEGPDPSMAVPPVVTASPKAAIAKEPVAKAPIEKLGTSPLNETTLNYATLREAKIALPEDRNSVTFNEFRSIKRKLLPLTTRTLNNQRFQNVVMVSSALPGEGKTFTSINLAITLAAEKNINVILVDGDVIRSSVAKYFSGSSGRGLLDLFGTTNVRLDEVIHKCRDIPNLHVIFSGSHNDAAPEMFASARMAEVCDALSRRYPNCVVIIDSPPVLATSEPTSLVTHIDHVIMVVAAGRASNHQVETALASLAACRNMYLLFNKAPKWQRSSQGSYYYYPASP